MALDYVISNFKITHVKLHEMTVEVVQKKIKTINIRVSPPDGNVKVTAPLSLPLEAIHSFVSSKLNWIEKHQRRLQTQDRELPKNYTNLESHDFQGDRHLLRIIEQNSPSRVELNPPYLDLYLRPNSPPEARKNILYGWYREQLKLMIPPLISHYEDLMGVTVHEFGVKKMRTRWGTCNPNAQRIWLNLELAKKPKTCLEYVVVHEMVHLLEPSHNQRFKQLMNDFLPTWRLDKEELNRLPITL